MVARLIRRLRAARHANIPNMTNSAVAEGREFDGRVYSLPWQSGFAGIASTRRHRWKKIRA
jgi:hypothetical protein